MHTEGRRDEPSPVECTVGALPQGRVMMTDQLLCVCPSCRLSLAVDALDPQIGREEVASLVYWTHCARFDGHDLPFDISEGHVTRRWWAPDITDDVIYHHAGQKGAGRTLDGRTYDATPRGPR